jgi:hypothetical protein
MKKFTKEKLSEKAQRLLSLHKTNEIFATQDGSFFHKKHEAVTHNTSLKTPGEDEDFEVFTFSREGVFASPGRHILTKEDLKNNPDLEKHGLEAGDEIEIPSL